MTADQNFTVTATGALIGADHFDVTSALGFVARPNATYYVSASLAGVANIFGIDIVSPTTTQFTVQLTAPLVSGDTIRFHVFDATNTTVPSRGQLIGKQILTLASMTPYAPASGTNRVWLRMVGGGGGGGGAGGSPSGAASGAGGSSGVYLVYGLAVCTADRLGVAWAC